MNDTQSEAVTIILKDIDEHRRNHKGLRKDIRKYIEDNINTGFHMNDMSRKLSHTIHDRPVGWIGANKSGKVMIQSTKGYEDDLNSLSYKDLIILFNHIATKNKED